MIGRRKRKGFRARPPRRPFLTALKLLAGLFLILLLVLGSSLFWLSRWAPDTDGTLELAGLGAEAVLIRDDDGIMTIRAESEEDAAFALGFAHAQDRLWQMDLMRRVASGRLAEILGSSALENDKLMRTLGLTQSAEASLGLLSARSRRALEAYAQGVNAFMETGPWPLAPEFALLAYRPEPWQPVNSLLWGKLMALQLSDNWRDELLRLRLSGVMPASLRNAFWPSDADERPITLTQAQEDFAQGTLLAALPELLSPPGASNFWALSGEHTQTGMPLVANDPHLMLSGPGVWYLARIETPDAVLAGATAPGVPFMVIGHNADIAWGFTTTHADTQDFVIEELDDSQDPQRYRTPDGWAELERREEQIAVRFGSDVTFEVLSTRNGPLIDRANQTTDLSLHTAMAQAATDQEGSETPSAALGLALAWSFNSSPDTTPEALFRINQAHNWQDFSDALRLFAAPVQNVIYGDTQGNIGFSVVGSVPIRVASDGTLPLYGPELERLWQGMIPVSRLPRLFNPPSGRIVNANNRLVDGSYPFLLSADWEEPYRARRIWQLLDSDQAFSVDDMSAMQMDHVSLMAQDLLPVMLGEVQESEENGEALAILRGWNGSMDQALEAPVIFSLWLRALGPALYGDEAGEALEPLHYWTPRLILHILQQDRDWCDDTATQDSSESCEEQVTLALHAALSLYETRSGTWGDWHRAHFPHPLLSRIPGIGFLFNHPIVTDGGNYTINRGTPRFAVTERLFDHVHGAGLRVVFDLADLDRSHFMIAPGQSGNPFSDLAGSLSDDWAAGRYLLLAPNSSSAAHELYLMPVATLPDEPN